MSVAPITRWAALWVSDSSLDGRREHIICNDCLPLLFLTRDACRAHIQKHYGYIARRKDLRDLPHGWRMPRVVRVKVSLSN